MNPITNINIEAIDYTQLTLFLKLQEWQKADEETYLLMNKILSMTGFMPERYYRLIPPFPIPVDQLERFPCREFQIIDRLWLKYSNGHFGFSVQKQIWFDILTKFSDPNHPIHQWERYGIDNLSPQSEVERCRNFKVDTKDEIFAETIGWYKNKNPWPCNNWKNYQTSSFSLNAPKGHLPRFWAHQFQKDHYRCTLAVNGGMMVSFGVGYCSSESSDRANFFDIIDFCQNAT